jgi:hypothetical protein
MVNASINIMDVNVTTRSKTSEEHVFKDREPRKNKFVVDWEVEKKLMKRLMVGTIQWMQVVSLPPNLPTPSNKEWTSNWARMPSLTQPTKTKL